MFGVSQDLLKKMCHIKQRQQNVFIKKALFRRRFFDTFDLKRHCVLFPSKLIVNLNNLKKKLEKYEIFRAFVWIISPRFYSGIGYMKNQIILKKLTHPPIMSRKCTW